MHTQRQKIFFEYCCIALGSILYGVGTVFFVFPPGIMLGGTSGISVILEAYLPFSPGTIASAINVLLIVAAFFVLGKDMATKTLVGSLLTTLCIGGFERLFPLTAPIVENPFLSAIIGGVIIAVASGVMFYVDSSSGGTDIIALIVRKYKDVNIGKALLFTDILIVVIGGILSGYIIALSSFLGFLIKTTGIDTVIAFIKRYIQKQPTQNS